MGLTAIHTRTHDLVLFAAEPYGAELPVWVDQVDLHAWGVVRRQDARTDSTSLGLRGRQRDERKAIAVDTRDIVRHLTPESLVSRTLDDTVHPGMAQTVAAVAEHSAEWFEGRQWGPTGSVGFQLATGLAVVRDSSDLDIILRAPAFLSPSTAAAIQEHLEALPCRVDCLLESDAGAVALAEWAASTAGTEVLLRTADGPLLVTNPWETAGMQRAAAHV
ncbi:malonate decarboxylase holo-ACP synthase [Leifsonia poae]|uniref:Phosphoribosyl-dephospho-CoA transferase n=1 Tax=Leifsonia poae TaxID=110933 RepID=A0A9W6HCP0_9MICO|nr:malonate decarboxylase holo-ACP synthase [Leifsonia poae]GLJ78066.1 phosphoribosyl-dephospho-CoA transferase [Leifsonia poae]